jgi:hypothetical protein
MQVPCMGRNQTHTLQSGRQFCCPFSGMHSLSVAVVVCIGVGLTCASL